MTGDEGMRVKVGYFVFTADYVTTAEPGKISIFRNGSNECYAEYVIKAGTESQIITELTEKGFVDLDKYFN